MDQMDFGYGDLIEEKPKTNRKRLVWILIPVLLILLLSIGGFALWSRPELLGMLTNRQPVQEEIVQAAPTEEEPAETLVAGVVATERPQPTATVLLPTEAPPEIGYLPILPPPDSGRLEQHRAGTDSDREEQAARLAMDMAIREPFMWEYLSLDAETTSKDIERYYIALVNREMGFLMTFNERYPNYGLAVLKFKQDDRRITIYFREARFDQPASAYIFYEGW